ncbi:MAG TPA: hypothetical protein VHF28_00745 [Nitrososphaera sp.]|nr:hypothetical protein [Nitrososphaera sp.]
MRIVFSIIPVSVSFIIILLLFYLAGITVSALSSSSSSSSSGIPSLDYGIRELTFLSSNDDSSSDDAVLANTTTALSSNSSTIVYETEAFIAPRSVKTFVIYMANEFHENWPEESHKLLTNKNAYTIPTNLTVSNGTSIAFHMADAPWDIPHDYIVRVVDADTNETVLQTPLLSYPKLNRGLSNSGTTVLPIGEYRVEAYLQGTDKVETKPITIKVIDTPVDPSSNMTAGFFYSPQRPVVNPYDNSGQLHHGNLEYYRQQFPAHGLKIESIHSFHFASCSFYDKEKSTECMDEGGSPGELYWHDNKTADHVLIFWSSTEPYSQIAAALDEMTWENVYT